MKKMIVFSTRFGGRAFDTFCNTMRDKIIDIKNLVSETDGHHIAWKVTYEDEEEKSN